MFPDIITTEDQLAEVVEYFARCDTFAFDIEGHGIYRSIPAKAELTWLSMATDGAAAAIPFGHPNGYRLLKKATRKKNPITKKFDPVPAVFSPPPTQLRPSQVFNSLRPLFFSDRTKVGHNIAFDLVSVTKYFGEIPPPPYRDTQIAQWILDENFSPRLFSDRLNRYYEAPKNFGLKEMVEHYFGVRYDLENVGKNVDKHTFGKVAKYSYLDSKYTWLLHELLIPQIPQQDVQQVFDLEMHVLKALLRMAISGVSVDMDALYSLKKDLEETIVLQEGEVYKAAGRKFAIGSVPQKQDVLYAPKKLGGQGLKTKRLTDAGKKKKRAGQEITIGDFSTDKHALADFPDNPVVKSMLAHAETETLLTSFVLPYLGDPDNDKPPLVIDGRVHPQFKQHGAVTGRFSCKSPNMQQVPRPGKPMATKVRGLFKAPEAKTLVVADYGQIELRVLAHYIGKGALYEGFLEGVDAHTATAALIFGVKWEDVTKDQRQIAKGCSFCVVYGGGAATLAGQAGISVAEAKKFLALHQEMFPEIYSFTDRVVERARARETPHIVTLAGRVRRIPQLSRRAALAEARSILRGQKYNERELESTVWSVMSRAERQTVNSLIQGSAADLAKIALVRLDEAYGADFEKHRDENQRISLCLTVHDEFVSIAPKSREAEASAMVKEAMIGDEIQKLIRVPLVTDVHLVDSWDKAK